MTCKESIKWLDSLIKTLDQSQYQSLWNWEQPLTEIKEMLESKRVVELPCKVGDRVYVICYKGNVQPYIRTETVLHMNYIQGKNLTMWQIHTEYAVHNAKDVIYTKSEAEQKLKELQNK